MKQIIANMRRQPLLTALTIVGTALAICLIMVVMMTREVQLADYGCEPYRSRTLYVQKAHKFGPSGNTFGQLPMESARGVFSRMKSTEAVAVFSSWISTPDVAVPGADGVPLKVKGAGASFFDVFTLRFTEGRPFTNEECESNTTAAILSRSACRKVFGAEEGVRGRTIMIDDIEYRVAGVVDDVSPLQKSAYADVWVPISTAPGAEHPLEKSMYVATNVSVALLAKSAADFPKIRNEVERNLAAYNKSIAPDTLELMGQPDTQEVYVNRTWSNQAPDMRSVHLRYLLVFAILLIVPAINISSMTQSMLRRRKEEIGVRRAFGAKRSTILMQTAMESLVQTLIAGLLGLILCMIVCGAAGSFIFSIGASIFDEGEDKWMDMSILFSPSIYAWALLFCILLNLISSIVPAWKASRTDIVEALK